MGGGGVHIKYYCIRSITHKRITIDGAWSYYSCFKIEGLKHKCVFVCVCVNQSSTVKNFSKLDPPYVQRTTCDVCFLRNF